MARFTLTIDCDNDAFRTIEDGSLSTFGLAEQLQRVAEQIEAGSASAMASGAVFTTRDVNGNRVGEWRVAEEGQARKAPRETVSVNVSKVGAAAFVWEVRGDGDRWRTSSTHGEYGCFATYAAALADAAKHAQAFADGEG